MFRLWPMHRWACPIGGRMAFARRRAVAGPQSGGVLCMGREISATSGAMQGLAELLQAARWRSLRQSMPTELLRLMPRLEHACEAARVAALGNLRRSGPGIGGAGSADRTAGFAELYAALRRARAETRRRKSAGPRAPGSVGQDGPAARSARGPGRSSASPPGGS